ncbi:unnamed protein product [Tuber aestivum]|uniref:Ribonuclease H2 subunit B n=1 Tax=Tuber aestivum TaxID=59557 RepID=A0A292PK38_9PEZI|nr:unnamed protein product [Tuber aestivum]
MPAIKLPHILLLPLPPPATDLKIITLLHPRTLVPTRYLIHPAQGLHEITKLTAPSPTPRSWLLTPPPEPCRPPKWLGNGQILQDGSIYICTPMDPIFVLLPRLFPADEADAIDRFLPVGDLFEELTKEGEGDWELVAKSQVAEKRLAAVCESVDVGDGKAYKPSREKLMRVLDEKCVRMAKGGLPASMEEGFIRKPLIRPIAEIMAEEAEKKEGAGRVKELEVRSVKKKENRDGEGAGWGAAGAPSEAVPTPPDLQATRPWLSEASQEVTGLLRIRVASEFISNNYLSVSIAEALSDSLQKSHDFTPLDDYLAELAKIRQEATAMRLDDYPLKRSLEDEEEIVDRKRKKGEGAAEKKQKKSVSRATKELQKADKTGMPRLTTFFQKKNAEIL